MSACRSSKSIVKKRKLHTHDSYQQFEIKNIEGKIWDPSKKTPNAHVSVVSPVLLQASKLYWYVEKLPESAMWSFFVLTDNNEKLYLSYEEDADDITLKSEEETAEKRWFEALLQPDMGVFLRAAGTKNRFICEHEAILRMTTTDKPTVDMEWFIRESFWPKVPVEIFESSSSRQMISDDSNSDGSVSVRQTGVSQNWWVIRSNITQISTKSLYLTVVSKDNGKYIVSLQDDSTNGVRNFKTSKASEKAYHVQTADTSSLFLCVQDGKLCVTEDKKDAKAWNFELQFPNTFDDAECSLLEVKN